MVVARGSSSGAATIVNHYKFVQDYKSKEIGRTNFLTEVEASEIKAKNKRLQTEHKKRCLMVHRKIEDFQTAKELGITVPELNQKRIYQ